MAEPGSVWFNNERQFSSGNGVQEGSRQKAERKGIHKVDDNLAEKRREQGGIQYMDVVDLTSKLKMTKRDVSSVQTFL